MLELLKIAKKVAIPAKYVLFDSWFSSPSTLHAVKSIYMMLSLESRESNDNRSLGELFLYFSDEMSDITWIQAFQMLLQMFRTMLSDNTELSEEKINDLVDTFMNTLPALLKSQLQAA